MIFWNMAIVFIWDLSKIKIEICFMIYYQPALPLFPSLRIEREDPDCPGSEQARIAQTFSFF